MSDPGGRFNVGAIDPTRYPMFPALYLAAEKGTGLAEVLGRDNGTGLLTPEELALAKPDSISALSVSGKLESIVDVRVSETLSSFVRLIKDFKLSKALVVEARRLGFPLQLIATVAELKRVLMLQDWRNWPMLYDVPASGQIFGGIAMDAGIEGILRISFDWKGMPRGLSEEFSEFLLIYRARRSSAAR